MVVVRVEKRDECVIIRPIGELTEMGKLQDLNETLEQYGGSGYRKFIINLSDVTRVDSSGLGTLYSIYKKALASGGKIIFAAIPERLRRVLEAMNFQSVVPCVETVEEAVRSLGQA